MKKTEMAPTWTGMLPLMLALYQTDPTSIWEEFLRMAKAADAWNVYCAQKEAADRLAEQKRSDNVPRFSSCL